MSYPLFDSGFTLWAADLDARLMERFGATARLLGVKSRLLLDAYYGGDSISATLARIGETIEGSRRG
ncbi:conserved hypothetical protein [Magnetospirillum sp. LM-5]|uniref:hypothetical protein n=1 Tax=Magnetospirillum sp. LM-5 TaxID=2681466 RepID=UPI0013824F0E|nr:hypothetical protein [Magnetospirillum sp. LM-5]CAA7612852.1 conserved hypothetical protein [Magnetospirillum sp. LM-5]